MRTNKITSLLILAAVLWHGGCEVKPLEPAPVDPATGFVPGVIAGTDPYLAANWNPGVVGNWIITIRFPGDTRDNTVRPACELRAPGEAWFKWSVSYDTGGTGQPTWGDSKVRRSADGKWHWDILVGVGPNAKFMKCDVTPVQGAFSGTITTPDGVGTIMGTMQPGTIPKAAG